MKDRLLILGNLSDVNNTFMANTQKGSVNPYRGGCLPHAVDRGR